MGFNSGFKGLITVNCFSMKQSVFKKRNNCAFGCLMLLCYYIFICPFDLILTVMYCGR